MVYRDRDVQRYDIYRDSLQGQRCTVIQRGDVSSDVYRDTDEMSTEMSTEM